tara:strand:- start:18330 stop:18551 length:222 start_codon:yes stop_codon:yes gene_type:complete
MDDNFNYYSSYNKGGQMIEIILCLIFCFLIIIIAELKVKLNISNHKLDEWRSMAITLNNNKNQWQKIRGRNNG